MYNNGIFFYLFIFYYRSHCHRAAAAAAAAVGRNIASRHCSRRAAFVSTCTRVHRRNDVKTYCCRAAANSSPSWAEPIACRQTLRKCVRRFIISFSLLFVSYCFSSSWAVFRAGRTRENC